MIKQIKIGAMTYKVVPKKLNYWGWVDLDKKIIYYDPNRGDAKDRLMTVFHECLHAISSQYGLNAVLKDDEQVVRIYEQAISLFFKDNKSFTKEYVKSLEK